MKKWKPTQIRLFRSEHGHVLALWQGGVGTQAPTQEPLPTALTFSEIPAETTFFQKGFGEGGAMIFGEGV